MVDPSLTRSPDGRVMCCICLQWRRKYELLVDGHGFIWDVCAGGDCAERAGYDRGLGRFPEDRDEQPN